LGGATEIGPLMAKNGNLELVTYLDGIGEHDAVRNVETLNSGRARDAGAAWHLPIDPHLSAVVYIGNASTAQRFDGTPRALN
jgi:hypothetical protein